MPTVATITLISAQGVRFDVATGALCLDFLFTGGRGRRARWERLHTTADFEQWLRTSRLAAEGPLPATVRLTDADLALAYELREVLWSCINDVADGRQMRPVVARALNQWAREPDLVPALGKAGAQWLGPVTGPQVLSTLARDAISLVSGPLAPRLRRCAAHDCALMFVDTSRPGSRRWCAMTRCGNRSKARTHRGHSSDPHHSHEAGS